MVDKEVHNSFWDLYNQREGVIVSSTYSVSNILTNDGEVGAQ